MNTPSRIPIRHTAFKPAVCAATLTALLALTTSARAQTDNFDSGALNPAAGWATFNNPIYPGAYSFPTDSFGGKAFRMQGGIPLNAADNGIGTSRVAAVCTNQVYSDFYVAADFVAWDTNPYHQTNYTFVGLAARVTPDLAGIQTGTNWSGVALFYWVNVETQNNPDGLGTGVIGLGYVINGNMSFTFPITAAIGGVAPSAAAEWTLEPGHTYRVTFQGVGKNLTGAVYDTQDLTTPRGTVYGDTTLSNFELVPGFPVTPPAPTNGWSGLCALRFTRDNNTYGTTDATFDNFYAAVTPPTTYVSAPGTPNGEASVAQVISRTPASWANFYSPAGGITFTGSTLTTSTTINTSAIRLILNGVDVSSSLTITPTSPATNVAVSFGLAGSTYTLASNTVYDASIILQDSLGRSTTNAWTFDTFTDAYLARYGNIECEDYDIQGGSSLDFPVTASGFSTNDNTWYTPAAAATPLGYTFGINSTLNGDVPQAQWGYAGMKGIQAATSDGAGDFYECARTTPMSGGPLDLTILVNGLDFAKIFPGCEYRTGAMWWPDIENGARNGDAVGTEEGAGQSISVWNLTASYGVLKANYRYDTKRQKYAALNAMGLAQAGTLPGSYGVTGATSLSWWDVEEYNVMATEGSDWFNYTHDWGTATNYNVYLRNACGLSQHLYLYNGATNDPAQRFGAFYCTNAVAWNWRYTPLLDLGGNLAVVNLGGTVPLRLEVDPEHPKWATVRRGLALNYMAFVPASSCQVTLGPAGAVTAGAQWQLDGGAWYNSGASVSASPGLHTVSFKAAPHWTPPTNQIVTVAAGQTTPATGTYTPGLTLWSATLLQKTNTVWTRETGATVDTTNQRVTNAMPASTRYYQIRSDASTQITNVSKSGANLILKYSTSSTTPSYQLGLNIRAWKNVANACAGPLDGPQFDLNNPTPAPDDSTPNDPTYFPNGLGTIGYATQTINMPNTGPQEHFTARDACGVAFPGPFPAGYAINYMVEYRGSLNLATAGSYNFATSSDDGSALWIDAGINPTYSTATVTNNFCQPLTQKSSGAQTLTAGYHDIIIRFNQGAGGNALQVYWDPTGGTNFVLIPGSLFYRNVGQ